MKDYKEMADSVFKKIEIREREEREKSRKKTRFLSLAASFAVILVVGVGAKMSLEGSHERMAFHEESSEDVRMMEEEGVEKSEKKLKEGGMRSLKEEAKEESAKLEAAKEEGMQEMKREGRQFLTGREEAKKEAQGEPSKQQRRMLIGDQKENQIVMNIGGEWINQCNIPTVENVLKPEDAVSYDREGIKEYFHTNIFPEVPKDLEAWENGSFVVYKKEGGKGESYYDRQVLSFSSRDFKKSLRVEVETIETGSGCGTAPKEGKFQASLLDGKEVLFFDHREGIYSAELEIGETHFALVAEGLKEEEVVRVVESLMK